MTSSCTLLTFFYSSWSTSEGCFYVFVEIIRTRRQMFWIYDDVIKWKHITRYWPFARGIHRWPVNSPHKGQSLGALMFCLIRALNKRLSKQSWCWWFETPSRSLWRHCNDIWILLPIALLLCRHACFIVTVSISTYLPVDKMAVISQTTFSNTFSGMNRFVFWFKFPWSKFLRM